MTLLSKIGDFLSKNILGIGQLGLGAASQINNERLMNQQNDFNASQAALNRQFQSHEAQLARQYQEDFYNIYQSPSAMVRQYKDAGLNPALMAEGYSPSTVSTSSPSGSSASATNTPYVDPISFMAQIGALQKLKSEIENIQADTANKEASADKLSSDIALNKSSIDKMSQEINNLKEQAKTEVEKRNLIMAQKFVADAETALKQNQTINIGFDNLRKEYEENYKKMFHVYPEDNAVKQFMELMGELTRQIVGFGVKVRNFVSNQ